MEENYPEAFKAFEEALRLSKEVKDIISTVLASTWFGVMLGWDCDFERALKYQQSALNINMAAKNLSGIAIMKSHVGWSGYYYAGKLDLAYQATMDAVRIAEESNDIFSKPMPYTIHGISCYGKGRLEESERYLLMGIEFCEKINFNSYNLLAQFNLGDLYYETGDFSKSKGHYQKEIQICDKIRTVPSWWNLGKAGLIRSKIMSKEKDLDLESLYESEKNIKINVAKGWMHRYLGEILLNIDDKHLPESQFWFIKAIESDQKNGMLFHVGKDHAVYAEWFKKSGDAVGAKEQLIKAIDLFKECGADGWVTMTEKKLVELR